MNATTNINLEPGRTMTRNFMLTKTQNNLTNASPALIHNKHPSFMSNNGFEGRTGSPFDMQHTQQSDDNRQV